jgi:uncharacterized protein
MARASLRRPALAPALALAFALVGWVCLIGSGLAAELTFPALTGRVVDEAALLSVQDRTALNDALAALETKNGAQLVVVTLASLQDVPIEDYGYQLGRRWGIGQKEKNTGALLIVAPNQRVVRIEVGYGLEGVLTDAVTRTIIDTAILPRFRAGDYPGGVKAGAAQIIGALGGDAGQSLAVEKTPTNADSPIWPGVLLAIGGVGLLIVCTLTSAGGLCRGVLRALLIASLFSRGGGSSSGGSSFGGGGGGFGGGGSSGRW